MINLIRQNKFLFYFILCVIIVFLSVDILAKSNINLNDNNKFNNINLYKYPQIINKNDIIVFFLNNGFDNIVIPSMVLYNAVHKYSKKYNIPPRLAFLVLKEETGYLGPFHYDYIHHKTSYKGAEGPFQIMLSTAKYISGNSNITREDIRYNIELNAELGIKYMAHLYKIYKQNWKIALGYYNTGRPIENSYSKRIFLKYENIKKKGGSK